jgi:phosphotransferase system HPr (HPr) family protein
MSGAETRKISRNKESMSIDAVVNTEHGLHMTVLGMVNQVIKNYEPGVYLTKKGERKKRSCRSVMEMLTMCATKGTPVKIIVEGNDDHAKEMLKGVYYVISGYDPNNPPTNYIWK